MFGSAQTAQFRKRATFGAPPPVFADPARTTIAKMDSEEQVVFGEVYAPTMPDTHGDFMTRETIKKMAYEFMRNGLGANIDLDHNLQKSGCYIVESFIAGDDDKTFIPGSWVIGVKVPDPSVWQMVKSGELNGFSLYGEGMRAPTTFLADVPSTIVGRTSEADGHAHDFEVAIGSGGEFLGGMTSPGPDGHIHSITSGTATDSTDGHAHRFSYVEGVVHANR